MAAPLDAEENERFSSLALFFVLFPLIISFLTSYYLKIKRITAVHETIVGLFAGMIVGVLLRLGPLKPVREMLRFSNTIMLNVLLPPIILSSGYELSQSKFFRNFGTIITFAFFGTFISAMVIGAIIWTASSLYLLRPHLSLIECLIFGSTLSATDPVTILAIFNTYKVDPQLYNIIFGESILNDAVSIVMFETLNTLRGSKLTLSSLFSGTTIFAAVFSLSMILGIMYGLACSLLLKHTKVGLFSDLESCIVMLVAYTSYFFSNSVGMSGIVSLLFCGITLKHYAYHSMSRKTQRSTRFFFHTLSSLSENFIFIYLGLSLFTGDHLVYRPFLILFTIFAVIVSRYCAVFPIAWILNKISDMRAQHRHTSSSGFPQPPAFQIPRKYQLMLFWAGLRGAVGFALSEGIDGPNAYPLQTSVLVAVVITVIVFGGTTAQMLDVLEIDTGIENQSDASSDTEEDIDQLTWGGSAEEGQSRVWYRDTSVEPNDGPTTGVDTNEVIPGLDGTSSALPQAIVAGPGGLRNCTTDELDEQADVSVSDSNLSARDMIDRANLIFRDGEWFQRIDERYLLPMFSNTVANRKHEQRKEYLTARRQSSRIASSNGSQALVVPHDTSADLEEQSGRISPGKNKLH